MTSDRHYTRYADIEEPIKEETAVIRGNTHLR